MVAAHVPVVWVCGRLRLPDSGMCCWVGLIRHIANLASCGQAGARPNLVHFHHVGRPEVCSGAFGAQASRPKACSGTLQAGGLLRYKPGRYKADFACHTVRLTICGAIWAFFGVFSSYSGTICHYSTYLYSTG